MILSIHIIPIFLSSVSFLFFQEVLTYPEISKQEYDDLNEMCGPLEKFFENCKVFI